MDLAPHRAPSAVGVGATGLIPLGLGYAAVGGTVVLQPLLDLRSITNGASVWTLARENGIASVMGDLDADLGPIGSLPTLATLAALVLAAVVIVPRLFDRHPDAILGLPLLAYLLTATYPTARYLMWVLPVFLLRPRAKLATIAVVVSVAILAGNRYFAALFAMRDLDTLDTSIVLDDRLFRVLHALPPLLALAAVVWLVAGAVSELRGRAHSRTRGACAGDGSGSRLDRLGHELPSARPRALQRLGPSEQLLVGGLVWEISARLPLPECSEEGHDVWF